MPPPITHILKTWPLYFRAIWTGDKTFECRHADRHFQSGDKVRLREMEPSGKYTGRYIDADIGFVFHGGTSGGSFGLESGYCIFSLLNTVRFEG